MKKTKLLFLMISVFFSSLVFSQTSENYLPDEMSKNSVAELVSVNSTVKSGAQNPVRDFRSPCDPFDVPIFENFDLLTAPALPECWTGLVNTSGYAYLETINWSAYSAPNSLYFYSGDDANAVCIFSSPELAPNNGTLSDLWISFYAWGYAPEIIVGTMSDPSDETTFTAYATFSLSNAWNDYQQIEVAFNEYTGDDTYIAIKGGFSNAYQDTFIDDITIDWAPTCPKPTDLYANEITVASASLGWTETGNANSWNIEYGISGFVPSGNPTVSGVDNPYELNGLESGTSYDFYVQSFCGDDDVSQWVGPYSFTTLCAQVDVPFFENFDMLSTPALPECWTGLVNTPGYAYMQTINWSGYSAPNSLYFYSGDDANAVCIFSSPELAPNNGTLSDLWISFYAWGNAPEIIVGTMSDPSDETTFTAYATFNLSNAWNDYQQIEVAFNEYTGDDTYIAIKGGFSNAYQDTFIDDITIDWAPTCPKPTDLYANEITVASASLGWTETGNANSWNIEYGISGFVPSGNPTVSGVDNPYELNGLESGTSYDFYVQSFCGDDDVSQWVGPYSFTTLCAQVDVPVFENFDMLSTPALPECWTSLVNTPGYAYMQTINWSGYSAPNSLYFYSGDDANAVCIFSSPELAPNNGTLSDLWISFYAWGNAPEIIVGTMSDPSDETTFTAYATLNLSSTWNDYQEIEVAFSEYTGTDTYIAIKGGFSDAYQDIFIDDITIDWPPACPKPTDLYANEITPTSANIGWTETGNASSWNIEYGISGFVPSGNPTVSGVDNPYELNGLESGTSYDFYVQSYCGDDDVSQWVGPYSFTTLCAQVDVPVFENFDMLSTPNLPLCWTGLVNTPGYAYLETINWSAYSAPNSLHFNSGDDANAVCIFSSPELAPNNGTLSDLWISFYAWGYAPEVIVGTMSDPSDETTFTAYATFNLSNAWNDYQGIEVAFNEYTGDDAYIAIKGGFSDAYQDIFIDDITIDWAPTCPKPTDLYANEITATSASLGWTETGNASSWNIEYGINGFVPSGNPTVSGVDNPYELNDLESGTSYDFYVQSLCGDDDVSQWVGPYTFTTLCDASDVPIFENFDLSTVPELPGCWTGILNSSGSALLGTIDWATNTSPNALYMGNGEDVNTICIFVSPQLAPTNGNLSDLWISFYAWGTAPEIIIGTMSDPTDESTFTAYASFSLSDVWEDYQQIEVAFNDYTGNDEYIALKGGFSDLYQGVYIDDITIDWAPECQTPVDVYATEITATSASIGWTETGTASSWNIEYGISGFVPSGIPTVSGVDNPYELTDLESGTSYDYYVQSSCGDNNVSQWAGPYTFTTSCGQMDVPVFEDFDMLTAPELPACWTSIVSGPEYATIQTSDQVGFTAPNALFMYNADDLNSVCIFVSPQLAPTGANLSDLGISFYAWGAAPEIIIGTMSDPSDESTFTEYESFSLSDIYMDYQLIEVSFNEYTGEDEYIALKGAFNLLDQAIYIDNITIEESVDLLTVNVDADPGDICAGEDVALSALANYGTGNYTYSWTSVPAGFTSTEQNPMDTPTETTTYFCEVNDGEATVNGSVEVIVNPLPEVILAAFDDLCINADAIMLSGGLPEGGEYSGNGVEAGYFNPADAGIGSQKITYTYVDPNGCENYTEADIVVNPLPDVSLTLPEFVCVQLEEYILEGGSPEGGEYSGDYVVDGIFLPAEAGTGTHSIIYTYFDEFNCENSTEESLIVDACTDIDKFGATGSIKVYPNPNNGNFTVKVNTGSFDRVDIKIVNTLGNCIYEKREVPNNGTYSTEVSLTQFAKGTYFIYVITENSIVTEKIMIL